MAVYRVLAAACAGSLPLLAGAATVKKDYPGNLVLEDQWKQSNYWKEFISDDGVSYNNPANKQHGKDSLINFCPNVTNRPCQDCTGSCAWHYGDFGITPVLANEGPINMYTSNCECDDSYDSDLWGLSDNYYYSVVNRALGTDDPTNISKAISLIKYTVLDLLSDGPLPASDSLTLWRGDWFSEKNFAVLQQAKESNSVVRFRVLASTSMDDKVVPEFGDFKYKILVSKPTYGPRNIKNLSDAPKEDEILFPPYYPFLVTDVDKVQKTATLVALTCSAKGSTIEFPDIDCPFASLPSDEQLQGQPSLRGQSRSTVHSR